MRTTAPYLMLGLLLTLGLPTAGCPEDAGDDDDSVAGDDDDSASEQATSELTTIEEYVEAYCVYAVDCQVWSTHEECSTVVIDTWFTDCVVADVDDLNVCAEWIASLGCTDTGWIDECVDAFDCD